MNCDYHMANKAVLSIKFKRLSVFGKANAVIALSDWLRRCSDQEKLFSLACKQNNSYSHFDANLVAAFCWMTKASCFSIWPGTTNRLQKKVESTVLLKA